MTTQMKTSMTTTSQMPAPDDQSDANSPGQKTSPGIILDDNPDDKPDDLDMRLLSCGFYEWELLSNDSFHIPVYVLK
jgi:hypothetical protein